MWTVNNPLPEKKIIDKKDYEALKEVLDLLEMGTPPRGDFALRFFVAAETDENHSYDPNFIADYLSQLRDTLGELFRFVLILDTKERFVALAEVESFMTVIFNPRLKRLLNDSSYSLEKTRREIELVLGPHSLISVDESSTIRQSLRDLAHNGHDDDSRERRVAVVALHGDDKYFRGTTSKRRLLEALLQ